MPLGTAPRLTARGTSKTRSGRMLTGAGAAYWEHLYRQGRADASCHIRAPEGLQSLDQLKTEPAYQGARETTKVPQVISRAQPTAKTSHAAVRGTPRIGRAKLISALPRPIAPRAGPPRSGIANDRAPFTEQSSALTLRREEPEPKGETNQLRTMGQTLGQITPTSARSLLERRRRPLAHCEPGVVPPRITECISATVE